MNKKTKNETPIADFLLKNKGELNANFHALPVFSMQPGVKGYEKYKALYGRKYFPIETTISGKLFDSFFYPTKCIKQSQRYTAELFSSNDTLFVTCGTSISNQIVIDALVEEHSHVLLDREAHQSLHFALAAKKNKFEYLYSEIYCKDTERKYIKFENLISKIKESIQKATPYDIIILSAASYDGVIYNIYEIIKNIIKILPNTKFIIDEAWSSAFYFHRDLKKYTAGYAAKKLNYKVDIVSTQSAHKSLMALRQASFIHSFANKEITEKLYKSRFKLHTTSPNYAILASMDLSRAHMQSYGENILNKTLTNAKHLRETIKSDKSLSSLLQKENKNDLESISNGFCISDPLKIHLNIKELGMTGSDIQDYLFHHFGIYFNRYTKNTLLFNVHIGITKDMIDILMTALKSLITIKKYNEIFDIEDDDFVISYPPGIPLRAPGDAINQHQIRLDIQNRLENGINVFKVN